MKLLLLSILLLGSYAGTVEDCLEFQSRNHCKNKSGGRCKWNKKNAVGEECIPKTQNLVMEAKIDSIESMITDLHSSINRNDGRDDTMVIGIDGEWPPYCYHENKVDPKTGRALQVPGGFIVDFIEEACKRAGIKCKLPLTEKFHMCWRRTNGPGEGLLTDTYDMCACWVMTPVRMSRVLFPSNKDHGWTKQSEGGFLTLSKYQGTDRWDFMKMKWSDGCNGETMIKIGNKWFDDCPGDVIGGIYMNNGAEDKKGDSCRKECPQGKIRIGYSSGWATSPASFAFIVNKYTKETPDTSRIIFIDEHTNDAKMKESITDYNHQAKALLQDDVDMVYTFANAIEAMSTKGCNICSDEKVWSDGSLVWHQKELYYAAGGVSGFFKYGRDAQAAAFNVGVEDLIADKAKYCPMCTKYWKTNDECKKHCIGCDSGSIDYCQRAG